MTSSYASIRVYINGVRFDPQSVNVSFQHGGLGAFSVVIPAVRAWISLPRRSHGVVFFQDPVTSEWRLMCEGEYMRTTRSRSGEGTRTRTLHFQGLHAAWGRTSWFNVASVAATGDAAAAVSAVANGIFLAQTDKRKIDQITLASPIGLLTQISSEGNRISAAIPELIRRMMRQAPVESYYMAARKWPQKYFTLIDEEIGKVFSTELYLDVLRKQTAGIDPGTRTKVLQLILTYLKFAMYNLAAIPAPPIYTESNVPFIPELMFVPDLNLTIPPACNVIFQDQINTQSMSIAYDVLPTRMIASLNAGLPDIADLPLYYVSNGQLNTTTLQLSSAEELTPSQAVSHGLISSEELEAGVVPVEDRLDLIKIQLDREASADRTGELQSYLTQYSRFLFERSRGDHLTTDLRCEFMPYLVPGFSCLIEDVTGPVTGILSEVSHHITADSGAAVTDVRVSRVREAYITHGVNRTPFYPKYLNARYYPASIADTYDRLFGCKPMLPESEITQISATPDLLEQGDLVRCDLDELVGRVVSTPEFSCDRRLATGATVGYVAQRLRQNSVMAHYAMQQYQFRPGVSLEDYCKFHDLIPSDEDLAPDEPHELFGAPAALSLQSELHPKWGLFAPVRDAAGEHEREISHDRQAIARMIKRTITEGASVG